MSSTAIVKCWGVPCPCSETNAPARLKGEAQRQTRGQKRKTWLQWRSVCSEGWNVSCVCDSAVREPQGQWLQGWRHMTCGVLRCSSIE